MKQLLFLLAVTLTCMTLTSCEELEGLTGNDNNPPLIRYLIFKYAEIPATMSNAQALAIIQDGRSSSLRANATEHRFPTIDSIGFPGSKIAVNHLVVTPATSRNNGGIAIYGGQDADVHPFQSGVPSSLYISSTSINETGPRPGQTSSVGEFEIRFNENELIISGSSAQGDFMDVTLESYNEQNTYGTGTFTMIARNREDRSDTRRWIIFDGEYALQRGR